MIKNQDFMFHNTTYSVLVESIVKPSTNKLFTSFNNEDFKEIKGINFRDINEINLEGEYEEFFGFRLYTTENCINKNGLAINKLGQGLFISIAKENKWPFILSDFKFETKEVLLLKETSRKLKYALIISNAIELDEPDIDFYKEVLNEIDGFIFRKLLEGSNDIFEYVLENSNKIFEREINKDIFEEALKDYKNINL